MLHLIFPHFWQIATLAAIFLPFILSLMIGPKLISVLTAMKAGQPIREARKGVLAPEHQGKVGTPTMGGIMIIGIILSLTLLFGDLTSPLTHCVLLVMIITATLGCMDDYQKITKHSSDGVSGWFKIGLQALAASIVALYAFYTIPHVTEIFIPFMGKLDLGILFIPLSILVIIGSSNAINLTDGLDGLASGCTIIVSIALTLLCKNDGAIILLIIASACLGFLWFNCNPAKIFMGDTGSLCLGGILGTIAVCSGHTLTLGICGIIFVAEALSVIMQVSYFKHTKKKYGEGRRLFLMAPLHHHFEKKGWKETQISVRFWIITLISSCLGILSVLFTPQYFSL